MKSRAALFLTVFLLSISLNAGINGDEPGSAFAGEYSFMVNRVQGKIAQLADAIPEDKLSWRPEESVRSISEVYLHLAFSCYYLLNALGEEIPVNLKEDAKKFETSTMDKKEIVEKINSAFSQYQEAVNKLTDEQLNKKINFFGNEMTIRAVMVVMLNHAHEHLGQSIAYARTNGVTPPWSAKEN